MVRSGVLPVSARPYAPYGLFCTLGLELKPKAPPEPSGSAVFSDCKRYRYTLTRNLAETGIPVLFVMLNPSTATATWNDPTIRRCIGFARREGASVLTVVNLFALRGADPRCLWTPNPFGPDNLEHVAREMKAHRDGLVIAAWGAHEEAEESLVVGFVRCSPGVMCLGKTKSGAPRHPLYVRGDAPLHPFGPPRTA